jgi:glucokinase
MLDRGQAVGLDVGGTKILGLRVGRDGRALGRAEASTPSDDEEATLAAMIEVVRRVSTSEVLAVGVGAAGLVDHQEGVLRYAPNLAWRDLPIVARMREALGLPILLDNDANAAALGEFRFGAGRGYRHMLLVAVGTGIGGGIVADGVMLRGAHGFAAEIGHFVVDPSGPLCGCGNRGCWEQMASGSAIGRLGRERVRDLPHSLIARLAGGDPDAVTGKLVAEAATRGDEAAVSILAEVGRWLGVGIAGLVNILDPQVVVVGGGAAEAGDLLLEPARGTFASSVEGAGYRPRVELVRARLGADAGATGAGALALEELARLP